MDNIKNERRIKEELNDEKNVRRKKKERRIIIIKYIEWQIWTYDQRFEHEHNKFIIHNMWYGLKTSTNKSAYLQCTK